MKRAFLPIIILLMSMQLLFAKEIPWKRGVNLTGWLQKSSASAIQFTRYTRQDFENIKSLGCDHIRLPIEIHPMSGAAPDYTVDPLLFYFLDHAVTWAEELQLYLILDNHSFSVEEDTKPEILDRLVSVWQQFATRYRDRSDYILYEVLNEPHGIADAAWNNMQQQVVDAIRAIDTRHTIVIGPAGWNSYNNLKNMPVYADTNLIYTFHFYDPMIFTHQGASWTNPGNDIADVPFPYDPVRMPEMPETIKGTWWESEYNNFINTALGDNCPGTIAYLQKKIDIAVKFGNDRNVPLWCGEFGVYQPNCQTEDRVRWLQAVRSYLEEKNISWSMWEYGSEFGIFEKYSNRMFDYDVEIPVIEALGLTPPPQYTFIKKPDTTGFTIYDDFIETGLLEASWAPSGTLDHYSGEEPLFGNYCIHWSDMSQYGAINLEFQPYRDLSQLLDEGYALDFWMRTDAGGASFDIRFLDSKTDVPEDHPWRMRYTINENVTDFNGFWHHVQIPLSDFTEHGSWDNDQWYNPLGEFDWSDIAQFQIVAEHHAITDMDFYFDRMRIVDPAVVNVNDDPVKPVVFRLEQNYPNPFNPATEISFSLPRAGHVTVIVYDVLGREIDKLADTQMSAGEHSLAWRPKDLGSGVYFYKLNTPDHTAMKKCLYLK
ncbi:MAG TPA: cellulase family glycosylhydrolase [bacterium]|nr:cellulase family glycosylhydrolase [bacterium]HPN42714.1 cellulase family glycosylhydrolase [bacterium]